MSSLPFQIERYIVKQLACEVDPETIADDVQSQFLREVTAATVRQYRPDGDEEARLPARLVELYHETHREFTGDPADDQGQERSFVDVASTDVFDDRTMHCVEEGGTAIALIAHDDHYFALDNRCTHQGGRLCEGELQDETIVCPRHGAHFDARTGEHAGPPATEDVSSYDVRVRDDRIEVKL